MAVSVAVVVAVVAGAVGTQESTRRDWRPWAAVRMLVDQRLHVGVWTWKRTVAQALLVSHPSPTRHKTKTLTAQGLYHYRVSEHRLSVYSEASPWR